MRTRIIINRHVIAANKKNNRKDPPIAVKTYKQTRYASEIKIEGEIKLIYDPENADCSGATVWLETTSKVIIIR